MRLLPKLMGKHITDVVAGLEIEDMWFETSVEVPVKGLCYVKLGLFPLFGKGWLSSGKVFITAMRDTDKPISRREERFIRSVLKGIPPKDAPKNWAVTFERPLL